MIASTNSVVIKGLITGSRVSDTVDICHISCRAHSSLAPDEEPTPSITTANSFNILRSTVCSAVFSVAFKLILGTAARGIRPELYAE